MSNGVAVGGGGETSSMDIDVHQQQPPVRASLLSNFSNYNNRTMTNSMINGSASNEMTNNNNNNAVEEIRPENVTFLRGHTSEAFICAWNPKQVRLKTESNIMKTQET